MRRQSKSNLSQSPRTKSTAPVISATAATATPAPLATDAHLALPDRSARALFYYIRVAPFVPFILGITFLASYDIGQAAAVILLGTLSTSLAVLHAFRLLPVRRKPRPQTHTSGQQTSPATDQLDPTVQDSGTVEVVTDPPGTKTDSGLTDLLNKGVPAPPANGEQKAQ